MEVDVEVFEVLAVVLEVVLVLVGVDDGPDGALQSGGVTTFVLS